MKERGVDFNETIIPPMRETIRMVIESAANSLVGSEIRADYNGFEILGFDFMITQDLKVLLIEVNTNPCLET